MTITRRIWIERCLRQIYNGPPSDDATVTVNLVNTWLSTAIGLAAKANYKDALAIDGIGYINNSFYTSFKNLSITANGNLNWKVTLPEVPVGIGQMEGISTFELKDSDGNISLPFVPLTQNQKTFYRSMQPIPNKLLYFYEGNIINIISTLLLNTYTADVTMISGGDSTDLDSVLNVPPDYDSVMIDYIRQQLMAELIVPKDLANDGEDFITTT